MPDVHLYASPELGAYGYHEKEWFLPHVRLEAFLAELDARGLRSRVTSREAGPAGEADLLLLHTPAYLEHVRARCATNEGALDEGPTLARAHIERAASHVVGAVMDATRRIAAGEFETAFVPIAGFHHAFRDAARLYCLYNDPAIALSWLLGRFEGNLAYVDIDVHWGDGVYEAFAEEPRVRIADLHEDRSTLFPFSPEQPGTGVYPGGRDTDGRLAGAGTKLNLPLGLHTTDAGFLAQWAVAEAFLREAQPRFVVFECGVDCLEGDPLSHQRISPAAIYEITRRVRAIARETAGGRLLVLGGGGYDLGNVAKGWATVVEALLSE